jgi:beta-galactosidase
MKHTCLAICLAVLPSLCRAQPQPSALAFFPVAVWYGGGKARAPMLEPLDATSAQRWGKDLDQIKALGFNTVKTWVDWATAEAHPDSFDFKNLDLLLQLAQQRGLRVIVQVYLDSAPDWVGRKYPDGRFEDRSGAVIESQSAPGFCIDHPGVRAEIVKFLSALSRDANRFFALYGWDVWSEPHVINWAEFPYLVHPEFCYCPNSQKRFRGWLEHKYGSLEALNRAWYRGFQDWNQVEPPRASTILSYTDYLDWRAFIDDKLAGDLKTRVDAIRSADTAHFITSHAAVPGLFTSPTDGYGEPDDWKMAANADFFGTSLYPKHAESVASWSWQKLSAGLDFSRSASEGKGFWIGELQAGQGVTGMRIAEPVVGNDLRFWMWNTISHGAREIAVYAWYPMSSGYESNGYGLVNLDGSVTERARAAGDTARIIEGQAAALLAARPAPAQVAILYNRLSYMVGGTEPSLSKLGNAERDSLLGLHRIFLEEQIPVDFIHPQDVIADRLGQYKIVFLPYPVMLAKDVAAGIRRYVENGGTVVAEARLAWNDARGIASETIPGAGLDEVFGAREHLIRPADHPELEINPLPGLPGMAAREKVAVAGFEEELTPAESARVLARFADGQPALVENSFGKGKAVLVGSFLALAYERQPEVSTKRLVLALAEQAGVAPEVTITGADPAKTEVRRLLNPEQQELFVFYHGTTAATATLQLHLPWKATAARNLLTGAAEPVSVRKGVSTLNVTLQPNQILALELRTALATAHRSAGLRSNSNRMRWTIPAN